jgi:hypothetical protein
MVQRTLNGVNSSGMKGCIYSCSCRLYISVGGYKTNRHSIEYIFDLVSTAAFISNIASSFEAFVQNLSSIQSPVCALSLLALDLSLLLHLTQHPIGNSKRLQASGHPAIGTALLSALSFSPIIKPTTYAR